MNFARRKIFIIATFLILIVLIGLFILVYTITTNLNSQNNSKVWPSPISYLEPISFPLTSNGSKKIENYVSKGSSFFCPNKWVICQKIQNYYSDINNKNFEEAYKYGGGIRSFDSLISTYKDYFIVSASYIKEESNGTFTAYVTLITQNNEVEYYEVLINADESSIKSSNPKQIENNFGLDCNYTDISDKEVCVFLTQGNKFANLFANSFFYKPQLYKGLKLNNTETIFYSRGEDGLSAWMIIYKYNSQSRKISFVQSLSYIGFADIDGVCTGDDKLDLADNGCAEKYLPKEQIDINRKYNQAIEMYQIK